MKKILNVLLMFLVAFSMNAKTGKACEKCKDKHSLSQDEKKEIPKHFPSCKVVFAPRTAQNDITITLGKGEDKSSKELIIRKGETIQMTSVNIDKDHTLYLSVDGEKKGDIGAFNMGNIFNNSKEADNIEESDFTDINE